MTWWCSATGQPWTWAWQAYPGVWLFVGLLLFWYWRVIRNDARSAAQRTWFLCGALCVWIALDWPLGALGAGYLTSFHTMGYILLALVAPPCLILGIPREAVLRGLRHRVWGRIIRLAARPWFALAVFNVVLALTHIPSIVDAVMSSQVGAFAVDMAWLAGGLALWWPVMGPSPELARLSRPLKMAYLFASTVPAIVPSAFLTFADYPLYATYELAPRIFDALPALQDQRVAGLLMKVVGDLPVWFAFGVIFFRWARESSGEPQPVHPSAVRAGAR